MVTRCEACKCSACLVGSSVDVVFISCANRGRDCNSSCRSGTRWLCGYTGCGNCRCGIYGNCMDGGFWTVTTTGACSYYSWTIPGTDKSNCTGCSINVITCCQRSGIKTIGYSCCI